MDTTLFATQNESAAKMRKTRSHLAHRRKTRLQKAMGLAVVMVVGAGLVYGAGLSLMTPAQKDVSSYLVDHAWSRTLRGAQDARPWPWIETVPVARLSIPAMRQNFVILRGTAPDVMALAPGWNVGSHVPGERGISLISSYSDTFFKNLKDLDIGDLMSLQMPSGRTIDYRVEAAMILDTPEITIDRAQDQSILVLSTTYAYRKWQEGEGLQYVLVAREIAADQMLHLAGNGPFSGR